MKQALVIVGLVAACVGCEAPITVPPDVSVVAFGSPWCLACEEQKPELSQIQNVIYVNVSEFPETAKQWHVYSLPTYVVLRNGREIARTQTVLDLKVILRHATD